MKDTLVIFLALSQNSMTDKVAWREDLNLSVEYWCSLQASTRCLCWSVVSRCLCSHLLSLSACSCCSLCSRLSCCLLSHLLSRSACVALSVPDSLVAFLAIAFLVQLVVSVLGAVQGFLAVSSDNHSRVYLVIQLLAVLASLAEISHDLRSRLLCRK